MSEPKKSEMSLDDFLQDAAKVVNPIQATQDMNELLSYTEEEIKEMDEIRDKAIAVEEALKLDDPVQGIKDAFETTGELKEGTPDVKPPYDPDLLEEINSVISDYGDKDNMEALKYRAFCYFADFSKPLVQPLLDRSSHFFTQMEDLSPYQLAVDMKIVNTLEEILAELKKR